MGAFHPGPFRTGQVKNSNLELIYSSLNQALGTAYSTNSEDTLALDTIAGIENLAIARGINSIWESNRRLALQADVNRMAPIFIPRWEKILGIIPPGDPIGASYTERKKAIALKFSLWTKPPNFQNLTDFLKIIIPDIFIKVVTNSSEDYSPIVVDIYGDSYTPDVSIKDGAVINGGATIFESDDVFGNPMFFSSIHSLKVQVWQPRDHDDNLLMSDAAFYKQTGKFVNFLNDYLPAYVDFDVCRYVVDGYGLITTVAGDVGVDGIGTQFLTTFSDGDTFEIVDDNDNVQEYTIDHIVNDNNLVLTEPALSDDTDGTYRILSFLLDDPNNLDNEPFGTP